MKDFILTYWKPITGLLFAVAGFIIALIKKRPIENIYGAIYSFAIDAVNTVETCNFYNHKGTEKLNDAIQLVNKQLKHNFPDINVEYYYGTVKKIIEEILSTPQKK